MIYEITEGGGQKQKISFANWKFDLLTHTFDFVAGHDSFIYTISLSDTVLYQIEKESLTVY